jgi:hypothetical protein
MEEIIIGTGPKECSATLVDIEDSNNCGMRLYRSRASYWISNAIFGCELKIYKSSKEGKSLTKLIESGTSMATIQYYIDRIVLNNVSSPDVRELLNELKGRYIEEGKNLKAKEIRKSLGII